MARLPGPMEIEWQNLWGYLHQYPGAVAVRTPEMRTPPVYIAFTVYHGPPGCVGRIKGDGNLILAEIHWTEGGLMDRSDALDPGFSFAEPAQPAERPGPLFQASYTSECGGCGWEIEEGDDIRMYRGVAFHDECLEVS